MRAAAVLLLSMFALAGSAWADGGRTGFQPASEADHGQDAYAADEAVLPPAADFIPDAADAAMLGSLAVAREGLELLGQAETEQERRIAFFTAIDGLTALYQLHGLQWAKEKLDWLYAQPDCPWLITGYSADGRIYLRVQDLEVQNPAFDGYTIVLCQFASHSALDISADSAGALECELAGGTRLDADWLTVTHPLWPNLAWGEETFQAPASVPSGFSPSYKQIFAVPGLSIQDVSAVRLEWGAYQFELRKPVQYAGNGPDRGAFIWRMR